MKENVVTIRMEEELKKELQKLADKDQRNLSDFIRLHLEKLVETSKKK
jgi:predicted transcriptional regulator